ncbi:MAG: hypothetical protein ACRCUK_01260 [Plesiomonas shigelloides]
MSKELAVIEVTEDMAPAVYVAGGLKKYFDMVKDAVADEVPDLSTAKWRARVASLANQVSKSKVAVEKPGREYLKRLKEMPKVVEAELRDWVRSCDELRDEVRRPLTEWEDEQKRIETERLADEEAEKIRIQIEHDHEVGLLMNAEFDRQREEKRKQEEVARIEYERKLQEEAAERARQEEVHRQQAERDRIERERVEAIQREEAAKRQAEEAQKARIAAEEKAKRDSELAEQRRIEAEKQAEINAKLAAERAAEQERQRIIADQERIKLEEEARAADVENKRRVNNEALEDLVTVCGVSKELAIEVIKAIASGKVRNVKIQY